MPLYEYECARCGRFEIIQKFSDAPLLTCPTCGGEVKKLLSAPAIQFKGTGWYITDYARKSAGGKEGSKEGGKDTPGKAGEGASTSSGTKDDGSASKDAGAKAAASGGSASKGGSDGGSSTT